MIPNCLLSSLLVLVPLVLVSLLVSVGRLRSCVIKMFYFEHQFYFNFMQRLLNCDPFILKKHKAYAYFFVSCICVYCLSYYLYCLKKYFHMPLFVPIFMYCFVIKLVSLFLDHYCCLFISTVRLIRPLLYSHVVHGAPLIGLHWPLLSQYKTT